MFETSAEFIRKCEEIEEETGVELIDVYDDGEEDDVFEDDGFLHVVRFGVRAAFDVGEYQSLDAEAQNDNTKAVLSELGIEVTERALM